MRSFAVLSDADEGLNVAALYIFCIRSIWGRGPSYPSYFKIKYMPMSFVLLYKYYNKLKTSVEVVFILSSNTGCGLWLNVGEMGS